eukprot:12088091-Heterocapsa_arctica.AAC.1
MRRVEGACEGARRVSAEQRRDDGAGSIAGEGGNLAEGVHGLAADEVVPSLLDGDGRPRLPMT